MVANLQGVSMNIFVIGGNEKTGEIDWVKSAQQLDNMRVVKMLLETCQLLSTALHIHGIPGPYKSTHKNHPSTLWTAESSANFKNLIIHGKALAGEYTARYNKQHKCELVLNQIIELFDESKFPSNVDTPIRLAMPVEFKSDNPVKSYRDYYSTKERICYPANKVPKWFYNRRKIPFSITLYKSTH